MSFSSISFGNIDPPDPALYEKQIAEAAQTSKNTILNRRVKTIGRIALEIIVGGLLAVFMAAILGGTAYVIGYIGISFVQSLITNGAVSSLSIATSHGLIITTLCITGFVFIISWSSTVIEMEEPRFRQHEFHPLPQTQ